MLEKLNDWILERHIRKLLEKYYAQFGITLHEAKTMSMYQLLSKIEQHLEANAKKTNELENDNHKDKESNIIYMEPKKDIETGFTKHIRSVLKENYTQFGLTKEDAEKMTVAELLEKICDRLKDSDKEFSYYANVVNNLDAKVDKLIVENKELKQRMTDLKGENKGLHGELAKLREENYKLKIENTLYKQRFAGIENEKSNTQEQTKANDLSIAK